MIVRLISKTLSNGENKYRVYYIECRYGFGKPKHTHTLWEPGLARANSGYTNWKREVRHGSCGKQNLGLLYKLKGEKGGGAQR